MRKIFILLFFIILYLLYSLNKVIAFEARSENYLLDWGNLNDFSGKKGSSHYNLVDTGGQIGPGLYESDNFKVMAGFEYLYSITPFSFTISNSSINFGTLSPNTPQTANTNLTVTSGAGHGYIVTAIEDHQLENTAYTNTFIEDTNGDNSDITYTNAGEWNLTSTTGFGYTLSNITGTDAKFTSNYKQFADLSNSQEPQIIMENLAITDTSIIQVTYKININNLQKSGNYLNNIKYICTGTF